MKFGMHIVHTKKSTMICIYAGKLLMGRETVRFFLDPKVPLRSSAGASLEVVLRAELGLVVSNSVRFGPVLVVFHKIKFRSGPVPVVFHKLKYRSGSVPVYYIF